MEREDEPTAIYARSACEGDGDSIRDQIRACRAYADRKGMRIDDAHVYVDAGVSGATSTARPGLAKLLEAVHRVPPPFATVLTRDLTRIGRAMSVVTDILHQFEFQGVSLATVEQGAISSADPKYFPEVLDGYAAFRKSLSHSVRRGQKARVSKGFIHGSRRFGYDHVPVLDPTRRRPRQIGVKLAINPVEAAIIRHIFKLRARGHSHRHIADVLNADNSSLNTSRTWAPSTVCAILKNPIYVGRTLYGRTRRDRHPASGKIVPRPLPQAEWLAYEAPDLRIVSNELWRKAQDRGEDPCAD